MKKISKAILCLASVAFLGSCAKSISKEEAIKIAGNFKAEDVQEKSGSVHTVTKITAGSGEYAQLLVAYLEASGISNSDKTVEINTPSAYLISATYVKTHNDAYENISWKADGNALSWSVHLTEESTKEGLKTSSTEDDSASYGSNGLPIKKSILLKYELTHDSVVENVEISSTETYTWSK